MRTIAVAPAVAEYREAVPDDAARPADGCVPPRLSIAPLRLSVDGDRLVLAGAVDSCRADELARVLASAPLTGRQVVLDLAELEFIDGRGCGVVAGWAGTLAAHGTHLRIVGAPSMFARIWQILGLAAIVTATSMQVRA